MRAYFSLQTIALLDCHKGGVLPPRLAARHYVELARADRIQEACGFARQIENDATDESWFDDYLDALDEIDALANA